MLQTKYDGVADHDSVEPPSIPTNHGSGRMNMSL
jgi:hypothetical protein